MVGSARRKAWTPWQKTTSSRWTGAAATFTSACPGPGEGTGTCLTSSVIRSAAVSSRSGSGPKSSTRGIRCGGLKGCASTRLRGSLKPFCISLIKRPEVEVQTSVSAPRASHMSASTAPAPTTMRVVIIHVL